MDSISIFIKLANIYKRLQKLTHVDSKASVGDSQPTRQYQRQVKYNHVLYNYSAV